MLPKSHRCTRRPGFTLIEVLVVVAIIALLVAILIPSLSRARFQAKVMTCRSNLHDLGNACQMYANTFRDYFPLTKDSGSDNFFSLWKGRFLANVNILICPGTHNIIRGETLKWNITYDDGPEGKKYVPKFDNGAKTGDISASASGPTDATGGHSYEYQGCYDGGNKPSDLDKFPLKGKHRKRTHFPALQSIMPIMFDNDPANNAMPNPAAGCTPSRSNNGNNCPQPWDNHAADGVNMLMGDGHTEWVKKLAGVYNDMSANSPKDHGKASWQQSKSALIDQALVRTQYPWQYTR